MLIGPFGNFPVLIPFQNLLFIHAPFFIFAVQASLEHDFIIGLEEHDPIIVVVKHRLKMDALIPIKGFL